MKAPMASMVESQWRRGSCLQDSGVFFPDDTYIGLTPLANGTGYAAAKPEAIETSVDDDQTDWIELEPRFTAQSGEHVLSCGGTSWEGEGYVAVATHKRLLWILFLPDAEVFLEVVLQNDVLVARSEEYPFRIDWRIPLHEPQALTKRATRM